MSRLKSLWLDCLLSFLIFFGTFGGLGLLLWSLLYLLGNGG